MIFLGAFPGTQVNSSRQNTCLFSFTWFSLPQIYYIAYSSIRFSMLLPQNSFSVTYPFLIKSWLLLSPYPFAAILSLSFPHILHLMQTFACLPGSALWQPWEVASGHPCQLMTNKPCTTLAAPHPPQHLLPPTLLTQSQQLQNQRKDKWEATVRRTIKGSFGSLSEGSGARPSISSCYGKRLPPGAHSTLL